MKKMLQYAFAVILCLTLPCAGALADDDTVVRISDPAFEACVMEQYGIAEDKITERYLHGITVLELWQPEGVDKLADISDIAYFESLRILSMCGTDVSDIRPLADLVQLEELYLQDNRITDVSTLAGLTNLRTLMLDGNPIADYSPLAAIYDQLENKDFALCAADESAGQAVAFADPVLEALVRDTIGKPEGALYESDVCSINVICYNREGELAQSAAITDLSGIEALTDLQEIRMNNNSIADLTPLQDLENLTNVSMSDNEITDIAALANLNLTELELGENRIADLTPLQNMVSLQNLGLNDNRITDISVLAGLANLQYLRLRGNDIADYSPILEIEPQLLGTDFTEIPQLQIALAGYGADDAVSIPDPVLEAAVREALHKPSGTITVADMWSIEELEYNAAAQGEGVADLTGLETCCHLSVLVLTDGAIADLSPLLGLDNLRFVYLNGNRISDLSPLEGHEYEALILSDNRIADLSPLQTMETLKELRLENNMITDISALADLRNLRILYLKKNFIADFTPVAAMYNQLNEKDFALDGSTQLVMPTQDLATVITFADPAVEYGVRQAIGKADGDLTIGDVLRLENLERFGPENADVQITSLAGLEYCVNLKRLDLGEILGTENGNFDFGPIAALTQLENLHIQKNGLRDISRLRQLTNIRSLWMSHNEISDISVLANMTQMECLLMEDNADPDIAVLKNLTKLNTLYADHCGIADLTPLAGLPLTELVLNDNLITDITALAGMTELTMLHLRNNYISDFSPIADFVGRIANVDFSLDCPVQYVDPAAE